MLPIVSAVMRDSEYGTLGEPAEREFYVIEKPLQRPNLRCITDRQTMQRIVARYLLIYKKMRDKQTNELRQFEPFI